MKDAFYSIEKAHFILEIFKFLCFGLPFFLAVGFALDDD